MTGSGGKYLLFVVILLAILVSFPAYAMTPVWNITNNEEYISDIAIADDGSRLVTGTMTGIATVYDQNGTIVWKTRMPGRLIVGCQENGSAFIFGSQEDIYSNKGIVRSYDRNGSQLWMVNTGYVAALGLAAKNNLIIAGNRKGDLIVLDGQGKVVAKLNDFPQTDVVSGISVSDNGRIFAYSLSEMYPHIRYFNTIRQTKGSIKGLYSGSRTGYGGGKSINDLAISSDGNYLITSNGEGSQGTLCLYGNGRIIWSKDMDEITDIAILANGSSVYAGTVKGDILGYFLSGNKSFNYSSSSAVTSLSLAADKNLLAAGNANGNLYLFNDTGNLIWTYQIEEFPAAEISRVEISRDGAALVALVNKKSLYYFGEEPATPNSSVTLAPTPTPTSPPTQSSRSPMLIVLGLAAVVVFTKRQ